MHGGRGERRNITSQHAKFTEGGVEIDKKIASGMVSGVEHITSKVPDLLNPVIKAIKDFYKEFVAAGENCVQGIWAGFQNLSGWLEDKVRSMMRAIVAAVEQEMDINSPSKVFAEIGGYMAEGIGEGFEREMRGVEKLIRSAMPTKVKVDAQEVDAEQSGRIRRTDNGRGDSGVIVNQNFYSDAGNYAKQQREAAKQFKAVARALT
jgi:hypothetical protein